MKEILLVLAVLLAVPIIVVITGGTFGQRCARAFPNDPLAAERCVYDLSHGNRP